MSRSLGQEDAAPAPAVLVALALLEIVGKVVSATARPFCSYRLEVGWIVGLYNGWLDDFFRLVLQPVLVGGLEHFLFFHILGIIIPTDSYFSEGLKPPTRLGWMIVTSDCVCFACVCFVSMMMPDDRSLAICTWSCPSGTCWQTRARLDYNDIITTSLHPKTALSCSKAVTCW